MPLNSCFRFTLLLGVTLFTGCQAPLLMPEPEQFENVEWKYKGVPGSQLNTDHYTVYTTCRNKAFVAALPGFVESCYDAYAELLPTDREPQERMPAYLFKRRREWERFTEEFSPRRAPTYKKIRSGGYSERGLTVSHYSSRRGTLSILAHEGLHQFLEVTGRHRIPAWINEGLACYFESFELDLNTQRPTFVPEKNTLRSPALRNALTTETLIPLRDILTTNAGAAIHQRNRHVRNYYAQEWSLVLFLLHDPLQNPYYEGFRQLLDELGSEAMNRKANAYLAADTDGTMSRGEAVFRAYVTEDFEKFESDYEVFLRDLLSLS